MKKRLFFAINLPQGLKTELGNLVKKLKKLQPNREIIWTKEENFHITLHFLGDIAEEDIKKLDEVAENFALNNKTFKIVTRDFDCFPDKERPKIIFLGMGHSGLAYSLRQKFGDTLLTKGFSFDLKRWHPHITLGRVRDRGGSCRFTKESFPDTEIEVKSFELMESVDDESGTKYVVLGSYELG